MTESHELWIVRHGETEWSRDGRHTSATNLPLTPAGEDEARAVRPRLAPVEFAHVLASPRARAVRTAELAGFPDPEIDEDLREWDYGAYEGISTPQIRERDPDWTIWTGTVPDGETAEQVGERLDRVVRRVAEGTGRTLVFAHGHSSRVLAARWLDRPVADGGIFKLDTATVSVLGYEHGRRAIVRWNA